MSMELGHVFLMKMEEFCPPIQKVRCRPFSLITKILNPKTESILPYSHFLKIEFNSIELGVQPQGHLLKQSDH
jgi:hypothetical protein